ncbi:MAG: HTTM domain-containing protein [Cyanothece sp. SIO1E1]|nr:HTTM domain-containing protein [Cyanothece sp. SIO1E1]
MHLKPVFIKYVLFILVVYGVLKVLQVYIFTALIESAFNGESLSYLNTLIQQHRSKAPEIRTLAYYSTEINTYTNRLFLIFCLLFTFLVQLLKNNYKLLKDFIFDKRSPLTLSIFRIVLASVLLLSDFPGKVDNVLNLDASLISPPLGWNYSIINFLIKPELISLFKITFVVSLIGTFFGFFTRTMIATAVISGFFLMGIPQFFGKIDHYHLFWQCLVILMFCNSGASLSIDYWRSNKKLINREEKFEYGIPIKLIMILLGLTYLFPGIWKFVFSGIEWAFSENLRNRLHSGWIGTNWTPFFRIDNHPILYQSMAFVTLLFELAFLPALFYKKTRNILVLIALGFHLSVFYLMKINFFGQIALFLVFINWDRLAGIKSEISFNSLNSKILYTKQKLLIGVGAFIILCNIIVGGLLINTWPYAVYPAFASIATDTIPSILIEKNYSNDDRKVVIPLVSDHFKSELGNKLFPYLNNLYYQDGLSEEDVNVLVGHSLYEDNLNEVRIYKIRLSIDPDNTEHIFEKELLLYSSLSNN